MHTVRLAAEPGKCTTDCAEEMLGKWMLSVSVWCGNGIFGIDIAQDEWAVLALGNCS